jgi:hypothetical protein
MIRHIFVVDPAVRQSSKRAIRSSRAKTPSRKEGRRSPLAVLRLGARFSPASREMLGAALRLRRMFHVKPPLETVSRETLKPSLRPPTFVFDRTRSGCGQAQTTTRPHFPRYSTACYEQAVSCRDVSRETFSRPSDSVPSVLRLFIRAPDGPHGVRTRSSRGHPRRAAALR